MKAEKTVKINEQLWNDLCKYFLHESELDLSDLNDLRFAIKFALEDKLKAIEKRQNYMYAKGILIY